MLYILLISSALVFNVINVQGATCPDADWTHSSQTNKCYLPNTAKMDYGDATNFCLSKNAELMTIDEQSENYVLDPIIINVLGNMNARVYLGIDDWDLDRTFNYTNAGEMSPSYVAWDTDPFSFTGTKSCAVRYMSFNQHFWANEDCSIENYVICQLRVEPVRGCQSGWRYNSETDSCFRLYNKKRAYTPARSFCQLQGGDLAKNVATRKQRKFINRLLKYRGNFWIGVKDISNIGTFEYLDLTPMAGKAPFKGGAPRSNPDQRCVSFKNVRRGYWINRRCNKLGAFICEKVSRIIY